MNADGHACIQVDDATYRTCVVIGNGKPHAVTAVSFPPWSITANYAYDANGSAIVITRTEAGGITYALSYDADNRLTEVRGNNTLSATFRYDGDGKRVLGIVAGVTTTYVGNWYEYTTAGTSYYYFARQRVAMRTSSGVSYIHGDHLGSAVNTTGNDTSSQRYYPWGTRRGSNTVATPYRFTGQREESTIELYFYNARWYDAALGRFVQADTVVPEPGNPQTLNRYSYGLNNPVEYTDPDGHAVCVGADCYLLEHPVTGDVLVRDTGGSGLYALIAETSVGRATAADRLVQTLGETAGTEQIPLSALDRLAGNATRTHFRGLGSARGDAGFAPEYRDDHLYAELWGQEVPASRQVGHFLTAVSMGYDGGAVWERLVVGHEMRSDSQMHRQILAASPADIQSFREAVTLDELGNAQARDEALHTILAPDVHGPLATRRGNSMEDLRLSVRGWRLGRMVASGVIQTNKELATWIALNVAGD